MIAAADELDHLKRVAARGGIEVPQLVLPASRQAILGSLRFHYLEWPDAGPALVLLHGGSLNAHTFDVVCLALSDGYRCLSLDQRGHGDSEWPADADYRIESQAGDLEAFREHLALDRFVLVGMSMGGLNAMAYAERHPERVAGLVMIDVGPSVRAEGVARILRFIEEDHERESVDAFIDDSLAFNPRRDRELLRASLRRNLRELPNGRWAWKWDARRRTHVDADEKRRRTQLLWDGIDRIGCPALVVRGGDSRVFLDEDAQELAGRLARGRAVTVPDAGHTVQGDNPAGLIAELRAFLREVGYVRSTN
jgi:pimeloyl-ACP methyl ester carboxylesterase